MVIRDFIISVLNWLICKINSKKKKRKLLNGIYPIFIIRLSWKELFFWKLYVLQKKICCHYCHIFTQFLSYVCPGKNYFFGDYIFCKKKICCHYCHIFTQFLSYICPGKNYFLEIIYFAKKRNLLPLLSHLCFYFLICRCSISNYFK